MADFPGLIRTVNVLLDATGRARKDAGKDGLFQHSVFSMSTIRRPCCTFLSYSSVRIAVRAAMFRLT